jgi:hypothetical protein
VAAARGRDQGPAGDGYGVAAERRLPRARVEGRAEAVFVDDVDVAAGEGPGFLAAHFSFGVGWVGCWGGGVVGLGIGLMLGYDVFKCCSAILWPDFLKVTAKKRPGCWR